MNFLKESKLKEDFSYARSSQLDETWKYNLDLVYLMHVVLDIQNLK